MRRVRASLLLHRGRGPRHGDLVLGSGARCLTIHLEPIPAGWRLRLGAPHRRRYLDWSGPLSAGRGVVVQRWHGFALIGWAAAQVRCRCEPLHEFRMKVLGIRASHRASPGMGTGAWRELVVPRSGSATLRRS